MTTVAETNGVVYGGAGCIGGGNLSGVTCDLCFRRYQENQRSERIRRGRERKWYQGDALTQENDIKVML